MTNHRNHTHTRKALQTQMRDCAPMWVYWIHTIQVTHPHKAQRFIDSVAFLLHEVDPDLDTTPPLILRFIRSARIRALRTRTIREAVRIMTHLNSMCLFDESLLFLEEDNDLLTSIQNAHDRRQSSTIRANILTHPPSDPPSDGHVDLKRLQPLHIPYPKNTSFKSRYTLRPRLTY